MDKIVYLGESEETRTDVFCRVRYKEGKLSITGVDGGNARRNFDHFDHLGQIVGLPVQPAKGWTRKMIQEFYAVWERWHLNNLRPDCEHQRAEEWSKRKIDPSKPLNAYGKHFEGQKQDSWNMLAWVRPEEHPEGLLTKPCPVCGYKYGTAWLKEEIPSDVIRFLEALPESEKAPAWV